MAKVIKIEKNTDEYSKYFDKNLVNKDNHVVYGDATLCGIQTDGDDGIRPSKPFEGLVTCPICLDIVRYIKSIKKWK